MLPQDLTFNISGTDVDQKFVWLCFALALWGLGQGAGPVSEALLAASSHRGETTLHYMAIQTTSVAKRSLLDYIHCLPAQKHRCKCPESKPKQLTSDFGKTQCLVIDEQDQTENPI